MLVEFLKLNATVLISSESFVLSGYILAVLLRMYTAERDLSDLDVELLGTNIDIDFDHGIPIISEFTVVELMVVSISLYYQYSIIKPKSGLQSLLMNVSSLILFSIFVDHLVNRYLINQDG